MYKAMVYDRIDSTIDVIIKARQQIDTEASQKKVAEQTAIIDRLREEIGDKPVYLLVLEPNDEDFYRCGSHRYDDVIQYLIDEEIYRYVGKDYKNHAQAVVAKLKQERPTPGAPLAFELLNSYGRGSPYEIQVLDGEKFIKLILRILKSKDDYLNRLSRPKPNLLDY